MNELINIKVVQKDFNGEKKRFVNARELHQWLGVGKRFATWITDRVSKYDFVEDLDYFVSIPNFGNGEKVLKSGKIIDAKTGRILPKEYVISVDMAKELAMVENSEIGKKVRKYFIRVESDFKKVMRIAILDPKIINQLASEFAETREETKDYRKDFTDCINNFVAVKNYGTYTDMLYDFLFLERAKEYRKLLNLAKKDFTRNYMYEEILLTIGAFETGLAGEIEKESKKLGRKLTKSEFANEFDKFASQKNWLVYQKRARRIMATYDKELRDIKHPKLIDYKKEFSQEDIKKLVG
ncbi:antA/AntB antirepressor family protein [Candidatus Parcubacteria bacterium]|nr:antA/AntB antirepressor family protein [Candidatus Parcubacteria bacterium]